MRDACLGRIGFRLDVGEEGCRVRSHRRKVASHVAADPKAIIRRQSFGAHPCRQPPTRGLLRMLPSFPARQSRALQ